MRAYELKAAEMFRTAGLAPSLADVRALAKDLYALAVDDYDAGDPTNCVSPSEHAYAAAIELKRRIGGIRNLRGYVDCIVKHTEVR
jgi:hypothetical protein